MRNDLANCQEVELLQLLEQERIEKVAPKLEAFRAPARIKGVRGGRGAGAKSWSIASLLIQELTRKPLHLACLREVQLTLEESVWKLLGATITRLRFSGWDITREHINHRNGSHIIFRGISDLRADQLKSLEGFDKFWIEEAQSTTHHSMDILMPTLRKPGSEIIFSMNPDLERDPIIERLWDTTRKDAILIDVLPGKVDNPWWTDELQSEMESDFKRDPELAEHIWNGLPRPIGARSIMSRLDIRAAMDRDIVVGENAVVEIGVDVARFGDDKSVAYKRKGMKTVDGFELSGADTQEVARRVWDLADRSAVVCIKVDDDGVGGGVTDKLRDLGAWTIPVHNGAPAFDTDRFSTCADEQWFGFPIGDADIPDDPALMAELSSRQFAYTSKDQKKIEAKKDFKKRFGRSPDHADALLLTYYQAREGSVSNIGAGELGL